jgi:hypothetical protein
MSIKLLPFRLPSTILVAGPTGCGKAQFPVKLLTTEGAIVPEPQRIIWIFSEWQPAYETLRSALGQRKQLVKVYDPEQLYNSIDPNFRNVLVLHDQMGCSGTSAGDGAVTLTKFFTQGSHHRNLTIIYIVQNLLNQHRSMRTVNLNSHHQVPFKNPRD